MSKDYKIKRMRRKKRMAEIERDALELEYAALRKRVVELEGKQIRIVDWAVRFVGEIRLKHGMEFCDDLNTAAEYEEIQDLHPWNQGAEERKKYRHALAASKRAGEEGE